MFRLSSNAQRTSAANAIAPKGGNVEVLGTPAYMDVKHSSLRSLTLIVAQAFRWWDSE